MNIVMHQYRIPNLANACRVLKALREEPHPVSAGAVAKSLSIPRTTCFRILETLASEGFISSGTSGYALGMELIPMGMRTLEKLDASALAGPVLERLTRDIGETSHLAMWSEGRALILRVCDSAQALRAASRAGSAAAAHCSATGKVFLAWNFIDRLDEIVPESQREARTRRTLVKTADLLQELQRTRKRGYATDNEEYHPGVRCIAAPVRDGTGAVMAAIGITGAASRLRQHRIIEAVRAVRQAADELSAGLGWRHSGY